MELYRYDGDPESSSRSSFDSFSVPPKIKLTELHIKHLNEQFEQVAPQDILRMSKLWEKNGERYDYLAKVEPQQRSFYVLDVAAVLTGRRRSQGAARDNLPIVEMDHERGVVKINPLAKWSFDEVHDYIIDNNVPYNTLLEKGYKSIGDWHSTQPVADGDDERTGRWKGQQKTECGIHNKQSRYATYLMELEKKRAGEESSAAQGEEASKPEATALSLPIVAINPTPLPQEPTDLKVPEAEIEPPRRSRRLPRVTSSGRRIGFSRGLRTARFSIMQGLQKSLNGWLIR
ncbi:Phosphoadenosine phosphosulfate reductase family-domain-containing protein [Astrocystis sublimbata]|nr:Phosphoadenosine phosphosulfate reductase family-domain-containing protein [Astrocystis sublimbata]